MRMRSGGGGRSHGFPSKPLPFLNSQAKAEDGRTKEGSWLNRASAPQIGMCALAHPTRNSICTLGGFKRSSQQGLFRLIVGTRQAPRQVFFRQVFSSQGS